MINALLVACWAGICAIDDIGTQMIRRPLLVAPVVGLLLGDLEASLYIGATLEVMWMGIGNVGAYSAPDIISGTAIGTALGILSGGGTEAAVALAVPSSLLAQQLLVLYRSGIVYLNPIADKIADDADLNRVFRIQYVPMILAFLVRAIPTFLAIYLGASSIEAVIEALPDAVMQGLEVAGRIIPAVGIGLLMMMMIKKAELWVFLLAGFALSVYLELSVLPVTMIALPIALLYDLATKEKSSFNSEDDSDNGEDEDTEEAYDL